MELSALPPSYPLKRSAFPAFVALVWTILAVANKNVDEWLLGLCWNCDGNGIRDSGSDFHVPLVSDNKRLKAGYGGGGFEPPTFGL
jgi:hypothetical protein